MFSLMLQVLKNPSGIREALAILERNPAIIANAITLIDTVQEVSKDGKSVSYTHLTLPTKRIV